MNEKKKLEFYGGTGLSFLPFVLFFCVVIAAVICDGVSERAMWVGCLVGLMTAFFFAKDKIRFGDAIAEGAADKLTAVPIICWIFAGIFTTTLRAAGLVEGIVWAAYSVHATGMLFVLITFIASALFATAAGTGMGTVMAGMSVLYPAGVLLGASPAALAGAIIGGGAFGDNLAPISDTTICSALSQGADVPGVVRSRLRYSIAAASITIVYIFFFGGSGHGAGSVPMELLQSYMNPMGLIMLIPAAITIFVAVKKGDIVFACTIGTLAVIIVGVPSGLITLGDVISFEDGAITGTIVSGIGGMADICILTVLVMGMVGVMNAAEGDKLLMRGASKMIHTARGAEASIFAIVLCLSSMTGVNTPSILAVGTPFAKPIGEKFKIHPYRRANILDGTACTLNYVLPWTSIILLTCSTTSAVHETFGELVPIIHPTEALFYPVYCWALLAVLVVAIITGWGRRYEGPNGEELISLPDEASEKSA